MGKPAARLGDMHTCPLYNPGTPPPPHVGGPVVGGNCQVLVGGQPAATVGATCICAGPPDMAVTGAILVQVGGLPALRMGDATAHGGQVAAGHQAVLVGDAGPFGPPTPVLAGTLHAARERTPGTVLQEGAGEVIVSWLEYEGLLDGTYDLALLDPERTEPAPCSVLRLEAWREGDPGSKVAVRPGMAGSPGATGQAETVLLQAVGGPRRHPAAIHCVAEVREGPCEVHGEGLLASCPGAEDPEPPGGTEGVVHLAGPDTGKASWAQFFWPFEIAPRAHTLRAVTCAGSCHLPVLVYPDIHWSLDVGLDLSIREEEDAVTRDPYLEGGEVLSGQVEYVRDGVKVTVKLDEFFDRSYAFQVLLDGFTEVQERLNEMFAEETGVKVQLGLPKLHVTAGWGWEDDEGYPVVKYPVFLEASAQPLFGIEAQVDILEWLLRLASGTGIGAVLLGAKHAIEHGAEGKYAGIKGKVAILFTASGEIGGHSRLELTMREYLGRRYGPGEDRGPEVAGEGFVSGTVTASIAGVVQGDARLFHLIEVHAGAMLGGKVQLVAAELGIGFDEIEGAYIGGSLRALQGKIYYVLHASAKGSVLTSHEKRGGGYRKRKARKGGRQELSVEAEAEAEKTLLMWKGIEIIPEGSRRYI